jgi:hypothetical protein
MTSKKANLHTTLKGQLSADEDEVKEANLHTTLKGQLSADEDVKEGNMHTTLKGQQEVKKACNNHGALPLMFSVASELGMVPMCSAVSLEKPALIHGRRNRQGGSNGPPSTAQRQARGQGVQRQRASSWRQGRR